MYRPEYAQLESARISQTVLLYDNTVFQERNKAPSPLPRTTKKMRRRVRIWDGGQTREKDSKRARERKNQARKISDSQVESYRNKLSMGGKGGEQKFFTCSINYMYTYVLTNVYTVPRLSTYKQQHEFLQNCLFEHAHTLKYINTNVNVYIYIRIYIIPR